MHSSPQPATGALLGHSAWNIHRRVIGALLVRELLTRYGRNNIGFLWLFVEPAGFVVMITFIWSATRSIHGSDLPIVAFALTGYTSLLLWRNATARCIGAIRSNKPLLYHRQVTILDIFTARILLEIVAISTVLVGISLAFYALGWLELPEDALQVVQGWMLLAWFAAGLGLTIGGLSEKAEVVGRFWHPVSYILMTMSGVAFIVDALPPAAREHALWIPMINAVEYLREGWFGSAMRAHYDLPYLIGVNVALTLAGLSLVRQISFNSSDE
jgi:ABC-type polysaccharide/polyol phosphate export permease